MPSLRSGAGWAGSQEEAAAFLTSGALVLLSARSLFLLFLDGSP